jgi:hypothetical protein
MDNTFKSLDTFYIIDVAAEYLAGSIAMGKYIDPCMVDEILQNNADIPCNTCGKMQIYTTNPTVKAKTEWEEVTLINEEDLRAEQVQVSYHAPGGWVNGVFTGKVTEKTFPPAETLFNYLFGECGDYEGLADEDWSSTITACSLGAFCDDDVSEALSEFLEDQPSENDINEYMRLKAKLGI